MSDMFVLEEYFLSRKYSDLTIISGGETFHAHKLVVCSQSGYFARACDGSFQESSGTITISGGNAIATKQLLQFLYTGDHQIDLQGFIPPYSEIVKDILGDGKSGAKDEDPVDYTAAFHALMYAYAEYFQIEELKPRAFGLFRDAFPHTMSFFQPRAFTAAGVQVSKSTLMNDQLREMIVRDLPWEASSIAIPYKALELLPDISRQLAICSLYHQFGNKNWTNYQ